MANHTLVAVNSIISDTIILLMPFNLRVKRKCSLDEYQNHAHTPNNQFLIMRFYIIKSIWSMDDCKSIFNGMKQDFFFKTHKKEKDCNFRAAICVTSQCHQYSHVVTLSLNTFRESII